MSKISLLPGAAPLVGNELIPIVQEGENRNITPEQLLENVNILLSKKAASIVQIPDVLIDQYLWTYSEGLYEYAINDNRIVSTSIVIVVPSNLMLGVITAAGVYPQTNSSDGYLKLYAKNHPASDFYVTLNII